MATIVTPSDFVGEYNIPNRSDAAIGENIQAFINKYEPRLLTELLGADLYALLQAGTDEKWENLTAQVKVSIVCYVYWWYRRDNVSSFSQTGETVNINENSIVISPIRKQVDRWNEMVDNNFATINFINNNVIDYGTFYAPQWLFRWGCYKPDILHKQNVLNL